MPAPYPYPVSLDACIHTLLRTVLRPGVPAVDATAGNGYDTLFLAQTLGEGGHVWAFDVQQCALEATRQRLVQAQHIAHVSLIHAGHQDIDQYIPTSQPLCAGMFNLGFLPGSDKHTTTNAKNTITALQHILARLIDGGGVSVHAYTGHDGGTEEYTALSVFCTGLAYPQWSVWQTSTINKHQRAEHVFFIQKNMR